MQTPLQLTFVNAPHSGPLSRHIRGRVEKLDGMVDNLVSCHVVVSVDGDHHAYGDRRHFLITVAIPGHEIVVNHHTLTEHPTRRVETTADRAFDEVERRLHDWVSGRAAQAHDEGG